jgi:hypothetical protein
MVVWSTLAAGTWLAGVVALSSESTVAKKKTSTPPRSYPAESVHGLGWAVVLGCLVGHCWAARVDS